MKWTVALAVIIVLIGGLVGADYFGVFGVREMQQRELLHLTFKTVDRVTHKPVEDVHVTCFRPGSNAACSQRSREGGLITLNFMMVKLLSRTWLFTKREAWLASPDGMVKLLFIEPNHQKLFMPVAVVDMPDLANTQTVVELTPGEVNPEK